MINRKETGGPPSLIQKVTASRKVVAFLLTSAATFVLLAFCWALSVNSFVAHTTVRLALTDSSLKMDEVETQLRQFWNDQTSDRGMSLHVQQVSRTMSVQNPSMMGRNFDGLREQLGYRIDQDPEKRYVDIQLALKSSDDLTDRVFVQQIAESIASGFAAVSHGHQQSAEDLVARNESQQNRFQAVEQEIARVNRNLESVRATVSSMGATRGQMVSSGGNLSALYDRLDDLHRDKDRFLLAGFSSNDPQLVDLKTEIEDVLKRIDQTENPMIQRPASASPFLNASHQSTPMVDVDAITRELNRIDTSQLARSIEDLKHNAPVQQASAGAAGNYTPPYYVKNVLPARLVPARGLPGTKEVLMFMLLSAAIGAAVAWRYEPAKDDVGFSSLTEVGERLNLPVISALSRRSDDRTMEPVMTPLPNLICQLAKFLLIAIGIMVIVALMVSPTIQAAFRENPFGGLARIVRFLTGR